MDIITDDTNNTNNHLGSASISSSSSSSVAPSSLSTTATTNSSSTLPFTIGSSIGISPSLLVDRYGEPITLAHATRLTTDALEAAAARGKSFVQVISCVLSRLILSNDSEVGPDGRPASSSGIITKFHALRPPSIGIRDYLERINKYANCSPECLVLMLIYIDRLIQKNSLVLSSLNVHRIVITAVMIAAKFFDDQYFNNAYYAKVGGMPCAEVNSLELEFLFSIKFSLHVSTEVYSKYFEVLANHMLCSVSTVGNDTTRGVVCDCSKTVAGLRFGITEIKYTGLQDSDIIMQQISIQISEKGAEGSGTMMDGIGPQKVMMLKTSPTARTDSGSGAGDIEMSSGSSSAASTATV
jgi:hypothetical protein